MKLAELLSISAQRSHKRAWLVTFATIGLLELVAGTVLHVPNPGFVLIFAVGFAAVREGIAAGLLSAVLAIVFTIHHANAHPLSAAGATELRRVIITALGLLSMAVLAGVVRNRLQHAFDQERELRRTGEQERARSLRILDTMSDGFITITRDWHITFANRQAEQILGVSRERMVGANALALFHPARGSSIHHTLARAFEAGEPVEIEDYFARADRWFEIRVYPVDDQVSVYFRDVTPRHRAQESIRFQSRLLDAIGQAVIATNNEGSITYWNSAAEGLFGWRAEEVVGRGRINMTHAAQTAVEDAKLFARLRSGRPWLGEALLRSKQGATFSAALADGPITSEDGTLIGMIRIVTDLTARKTIEEEHRFLAVASAALAATLDVESTIRTLTRLAVPTLADSCLVDLVDEDGTIRRLEALHTDPAKDQIVRELMRRYPSGPADTHPLIDVVRTGQSQLFARVSESLLRSIANDSRHLALLREVSARSAMIVPLIAHGRILGAVTLLSVTEDRTYTARDLRTAEELVSRAAVGVENARLYEAVVVASRAKSDFLAVMSHELRTPLTTVMGYADLLLAGVPQPLEDKSQVYVERIRAAAWHLLGIIEQILIYARIEGGREQLHPQRVNVPELMREAAALIEPVAAEKGLGFQVLPAPDAFLETDPNKLRQILLNLLSNAVKFTESGRVTLEAQVEGRQVTFIVRDTGIGIAAEHVQKVFDAFWQVDQSSTRHVGGTGLGLSVARRLTRLLGGDVSVQSREGEGTTFRVELPSRWGGVAGPPKSVEKGAADNRPDRGDESGLTVASEENGPGSSARS
jgi:PAS domain S-box-containing protein